MRPPRTLLIVAECVHWRVEDRVMAPEHFVLEMELWAKMFEQVWIYTEFKQGKPASDAIPYRVTNVHFGETRGADRPGLLGKLLSLHRIPPVALKLWQALGQADAVHIRAPCRNALLALLLLKARPRPGYYKYAAMWGDAQSPTTWKVQQYLLTRLQDKAIVTVYGSANAAPYGHFRSTPTTSLTRSKITQLAEASLRRCPPPPFYFLWVGGFGPMKDVPTLLRAFALLPPGAADVRLRLVGDGQGLDECRRLVQRLGIAERVEFLSRLGWDSLAGLYGTSHCFVLPSKDKEGWPKVLMEAMAAGLPCIATDIGALPEILGYGERGIVVPPGSPQRLASAMWEVVQDPVLRARLGQAGAEFSRAITIAHVVDQYRRWLEEAWGCQLPSVLEELP